MSCLYPGGVPLLLYWASHSEGFNANAQWSLDKKKKTDMLPRFCGLLHVSIAGKSVAFRRPMAGFICLGQITNLLLGVKTLMNPVARFWTRGFPVIDPHPSLPAL